MSCLLIDAGNSRVKWGWGSGQDVVGVVAVENAHLQQIPQQWKHEPVPEQIRLCNSAGPERQQQIQQWSTALWGVEATEVTVARHWSGLVNGYRQPQQLGVDRWLGMVAVWSRVQGAFCLVDCGTAVTIDFVDAEGRHQGGNILPGIGSTMEQLLQRAPHLEPHYHRGVGCLLGRSTEEALLPAEKRVEIEIEEAIAAIQSRFGEFELWVTGGAGMQLPVNGVSCTIHRSSDLVLQGLWSQAVSVD